MWQSGRKCSPIPTSNPCNRCRSGARAQAAGLRTSVSDASTATCTRADRSPSRTAMGSGCAATRTSAVSRRPDGTKAAAVLVQRLRPRQAWSEVKAVGCPRPRHVVGKAPKVVAFAERANRPFVEENRERGFSIAARSAHGQPRSAIRSPISRACRRSRSSYPIKQRSTAQKRLLPTVTASSDFQACKACRARSSSSSA